MSQDPNNIVEVIRQSPPIDTSLPYDAGWVAGKTIVITGGASGFGEGFFRKWAENVNMLRRRKCHNWRPQRARGRALVEEIRKSTGNQNHHFVPLDVTNWQNQVDFFREALKLSPHGGIDAVVANAGITDGVPAFDDPPETLATLEEPPKPNFKCYEVNMTGVMYTAHLAIFHLGRNPNSKKANPSTTPGPNQRDRHLLLIGSIASIAAIPTQIQYCVSKHGVLGLFRSLRTTSFMHGARVNILLPYFIDTPIIHTPARLLLAGGASGKPEDVVEAGTRLMADSRICGRALAIGPKVTVENDYELVPKGSENGKETAIWEAYAHDYEETEVFTRRLVGLLNRVERIRGWAGWSYDLARAFLYPIQSWLKR
ncbi:5'-hydroxyaverantin dehydrogenase [Lachnellula occidentalis]|uniref:5'-hydroxyaverantin dehydrogenase n=1 Tax=Lachnellula occidentalis TaxID=215460 RepID=A0A8H8UJ71_9HELO|nr:5'-hydroxyaverantin dehydrogenase [Lachnellula occidentalis]